MVTWKAENLSTQWWSQTLLSALSSNHQSLSSNLPLFPAAHEPRSSRAVEATSTEVICRVQFSARICFWSPDSCSCTAALKIRLPESGLKCLNLKHLIQIFPIWKQPRSICKADTVSVGESTSTSYVILLSKKTWCDKSNFIAALLGS